MQFKKSYIKKFAPYSLLINRLKRKVLIEFVKISTDPIVRNCNGSSFQSCGAAA